MSSILSVITNHNFNENAIRLKRNISKYFPTIIVDSGSSKQPDEFDIKMGNVYYTGLWNESVRQAIERKADWLLFVASDIQIEDYERLYNRINIATADSDIGMYSPSLAEGSRCAYLNNFTQNSGGFRDVRCLEGFFFLCRVSILEKQYPIDPSINVFGWSIDSITSKIAKKAGYRIVVDDEVAIFHPESKAASYKFNKKAYAQGRLYAMTYRLFSNAIPKNTVVLNFLSPLVIHYYQHFFVIHFFVKSTQRKCLTYIRNLKSKTQKNKHNKKAG